jgi:hypothetical protein
LDIVVVVAAAAAMSKQYSETRLRKTQLRNFPAKEVRIKKHQNSPILLKSPF